MSIKINEGDNWSRLFDRWKIVQSAQWNDNIVNIMLFKSSQVKLCCVFGSRALTDNGRLYDCKGATMHFDLVLFDSGLVAFVVAVARLSHWRLPPGQLQQKIKKHNKPKYQTPTNHNSFHAYASKHHTELFLWFFVLFLLYSVHRYIRNFLMHDTNSKLTQLHREEHTALLTDMHICF